MSLQFKDNFYIEINNEKLLNIKDNKIKSLKVRIEASHAGVVNQNDVFYTPRALREGAITLVDPIEKTIQKRHYSKTVGKIVKADYVDNLAITDYHYHNIDNAKSPEELVAAVNTYIKSDTFNKNSKKGLGGLFVDATIVDKDKILELRDNKSGYVSIAGEALAAYCSICAKPAMTCSHVRGKVYNKRKAFIIADSSELDHISFEEDPADLNTNTQIRDNNQLVTTLDIIDVTQGNTMKLTLQELKDKLGDYASLLANYNLSPDLEIKDSETQTDYLFSEEKLLPLTTKASLYIAKKLILDLEDSVEEKEFLNEKTTLAYNKVVGEEVSLEVLEQELLAIQPNEIPEPVNTIVQPQPIFNKDELRDLIKEELVALKTELSTIQNTIQDSANKKGNEFLMSEIKSLRSVIELRDSVITKLTEDLKTAIIDSISLKISDESKKQEFLEKVKDANLSEIKVAVQLFDSFVKPVEQVETQQPISVIDTNTAVNNMDSNEDPANLQIEDSNKKATEHFNAFQATLSADTQKITKGTLESQFRKVAISDGLDIARKFTTLIKNKYDILA